MPKDVKIKIKGDMTQAQATIGQLEDSTKKTFGKMSKSADKSGKEISDAYRKMGIRTDAAIKASTEDAKRNFQKIKNFGKASANEIKKAHAQMTATIKRNNKELTGGARRLSKGFDAIKGRILAAAAVAATAAATFATITFGKKVLSESIKFESALLDLQKVMSDTEGDAARFTGTVNKLAKAYGVSAAEILQGAANFKQAGFDLEEAFLLQKTALDLVIAGDIEAAQAADLLVAALKGFKAPASEAPRLINVLNEVSNRYATSLGELAIGMAEFSPIAKKMGFSFEETAGILTPVIEVFRSGSEAAQALKTGLLQLISDNKTVQDALAQLGVSQTDSNGALRSGEEILKDVSIAFTKLSENQKIYFAGQLTGIRQAGKMVEVFDGLNKTTEIIGVALDSAGSAAKEVAIRLGSTEVKIKKMKETFSVAARVIGDELKPALNVFVDILTKIIPIIGTVGLAISGGLTAVFNTAKLAALGLSQGILFFAKGITFLTDKLGITNDATAFVDGAMKELDERLITTRENIGKATRQMLGMQRAEEKLIRSGKELTKGIKDQNEGLEKQEELLKILTEAQKKAIKERITQLKTVETAQKTTLQATKLELAELQAAIQNAASFAQSIKRQFEGADITAAQIGFTQVEVIVDNIKRARVNLQKAREAFLRGDIESAQRLNRQVADAIVAATSVDPKKLREAGQRTRGLKEAQEQAAAIREEVLKLNNEMEQTARDKVPAITAKITILKDEIVATQAATKALNDELNLPTKKIFTIERREIQAKSEGGPVKARLGRHLPGYGGGDRIPALLEKGEFVLRKEAVRKMGLHAVDAINRMDLSALLAHMQTKNIQKFAEGGAVQEPADNVNVNLLMGEKTFKSTMPRNSAAKFVSEIKRMNIIHGRRTPPY